MQIKCYAALFWNSSNYATEIIVGAPPMCNVCDPVLVILTKHTCVWISMYLQVNEYNSPMIYLLQSLHIVTNMMQI